MAQASLHTRTHPLTRWSGLIPDDEWCVYRDAMDAARAASIPFAVGGAFALAAYTGFWRNTKDLDLYVLPRDRERMIAILGDLGMADYYETHSYDRWWIYRATRNDSIVDIIWAMANHRAQIDDLWLSGPEIEIREHRVRVLPAEAMLWDKLYIMQRDRCDWPDALNLLYFAGAGIDWEYLLFRIGDDAPLLAGALSAFRWVAPGRAESLPSWLWERLGIPPAPAGRNPEVDRRRASLLDTRPWFGPDLERLS